MNNINNNFLSFLLKAFFLSALFLSCSIYADTQLPFSNLFIFGDSLSDIGNIDGSPYTDRNSDGSGLLWDNDLGNALGLSVNPSQNGGNNYAAAGAVTGNLGFDTGSTAPTMETQLQSYLNATSGKADPKGLYTIWGGGNDIKDAFLHNHDHIPLSSIILASVGNIVDMVKRLHLAGAQYIIVPNLPNIGKTPVIVNGAPILVPIITKIIHAYNNQLLSSLNATGYNIIQLDAANMLNAVQNNYAAFGFTGPESTTCNPLSLVTCNNSEDIFFSDGFHPSQAAHRIAADYILSVLQGPEFASFLSQTPVSVMAAQNTQIQSELSGIRSGMFESAENQWRVFAGGSYTQSHKNTDNLLAPGYQENNTGFVVGADKRMTSDIIIGGAVGRSSGKITFGNNISSYKFDLNENITTLFSSYAFYHQQAYLNTSLGLGLINENNIQRNFNLGILPETVFGKTSGEHYDAAANLGYILNLSHKNIQTGPLVSLEYQYINIRPYSETSSHFQTNTGGAFDALQYDKQRYESLTGGIGWQLNDKLTFNNTTIMPFIQMAYHHELLNSNNFITAGVSSLPGSHFKLPINRMYQDTAIGSAGIQSILNNHLAMTVAYNYAGSRNFKSQNIMLNFSLPL